MCIVCTYRNRLIVYSIPDCRNWPHTDRGKDEGDDPPPVCENVRGWLINILQGRKMHDRKMQDWKMQVPKCKHSSIAVLYTTKKYCSTTIFLLNLLGSATTVDWVPHCPVIIRHWPVVTLTATICMVYCAVTTPPTVGTASPPSMSPTAPGTTSPPRPTTSGLVCTVKKTSLVYL